MKSEKIIASLRDTVSLLDETNRRNVTLNIELQHQVEQLQRQLAVSTSKYHNILAELSEREAADILEAQHPRDDEETIELLVKELNDMEKRNTQLERELEDCCYLNYIQTQRN